MKLVFIHSWSPQVMFRDDALFVLFCVLCFVREEGGSFTCCDKAKEQQE